MVRIAFICVCRVYVADSPWKFGLSQYLSEDQWCLKGINTQLYGRCFLRRYVRILALAKNNLSEKMLVGSRASDFISREDDSKAVLAG